MHWHERLPIIRLLVRAAGPVLGRLVEDRGLRVVAARVVGVGSFRVLFVAPEQLTSPTAIQRIQHIIIDGLHRLRGRRRTAELYI